MATKVHMEALSPTMEEGQVVKWLKSEGDDVTNGDIIAEIETDKATMELTARGDGVLRAILLGEGGTAPVGAVIALIGATDEDISEYQAAARSASQGNGAGPDAGDDASADVGGSVGPGAVVGGSDGTVDGRIKASPLARRLAADSGLQLSTLAGSGPAGRIVKRDVEAAIAAGPSAATVPAATGPAGAQAGLAVPRPTRPCSSLPEPSSMTFRFLRCGKRSRDG